MYNTTMIERRVYEYVSMKQEGDSWDFKREWHGNQSDLLHDIICMSNLLGRDDGIIIIGVDEENDYDLVDVTGDTNRRLTQDIVCFLRDKRFSGGVRPIVFVHTMIMSGKSLDVIVVKNTRNTPYYLTKDFMGLKAYHIYSRIMDTNTPKPESADVDVVERLWKKRFALDAHAVERIQQYLMFPDDWSQTEEETKYYYKYAPEYTIEIIADQSRDGYEYYLFSQCDPRPHWYDIYLKCHQTTLAYLGGVGLDGGRALTASPDFISFIPDGRYHNDFVAFRGYVKGTLRHAVFEFLLREDNEYSEAAICRRRLLECVLVFESEEEQEGFLAYAQEHYEQCELKADTIVPRCSKYLDNGQNPEVFREDYSKALKAKQLLEEYRAGR